MWSISLRTVLGVAWGMWGMLSSCVNSIVTSMLRCVVSLVNSPHLNPVNHQWCSGPRLKSLLPFFFKVNDNLNNCISKLDAQLKNLNRSGIAPRFLYNLISGLDAPWSNVFGSEPARLLGSILLYNPISAPVSIPYWPFHSSIIQCLPKPVKYIGSQSMIMLPLGVATSYAQVYPTSLCNACIRE